MKTKIEMLRKNGTGLKGTIANAKHHAQAMLPFIDALKDKLTDVGFGKWRQGHNVHEFVRTDDGQRFTLRAYVRDGAYVGVRLSLRVNRSTEIRLADIQNVGECDMLLTTMFLLAGPEMGSVRSLGSSNVQ